MVENFTFLTLVPEIRDQIYEIVLTSSIAPPKSPSASGPRTEPHIIPLESTTYYPLQPYRWPGAALVRTCHQVCTEVSALARVVDNRNRAQKKVNYELDIMIDEELALYPTWLNSLSASPTEQWPVNQIWANLRTIGLFNAIAKWGGMSGWTDANAWLWSLVWDLFWGLFSMLNRFFDYGLSFQKPCVNNQIGLPGERHMAINVPRLEELVINVVTPTEEEMEGRSYTDRLNWESVGVLHPEKVLLILKRIIGHHQNPATHAGKIAIGYGYFEKLGKIRLCLDEKEVGSWGFSSRLGCKEVLDLAATH